MAMDSEKKERSCPMPVLQINRSRNDPNVSAVRSVAFTSDDSVVESPKQPKRETDGKKERLPGSRLWLTFRKNIYFATAIHTGVALLHQAMSLGDWMIRRPWAVRHSRLWLHNLQIPSVTHPLSHQVLITVLNSSIDRSYGNSRQRQYEDHPG